MNHRINLLILLIGLAFSSTTVAHGKDQHDAKSKLFVGMDTQAAKVVKAFHHALQTGDNKAARVLLADDVLIFEGGRVERAADEYANHHMKADIKFLKHLNITPIEHQVQVFDDTAISMYRAKSLGNYKGNKIDKQSMETMLLTKQSDGYWKIKNIHWSN